MSRKYLATVIALVAVAALAFAATATGSGNATQSQTRIAAAGSTQQVGMMNVRVTIQKFVRRGKKLYAVGTTYAKFAPVASRSDLPTATSSRRFTARVLHMKAIHSAQRICPVLELSLAPTHLNLLGLIVDLSNVHLVITADSQGGLLGRLLCSLAGQGGAQQAQSLTKAAHRSGLSTKGVRMGVPLYQTSSGSISTGPNASPQMICSILDLTLGPLDLNLLGLIVHLDQVHLTITADSEGGILGSLLCSIGGGAPGS
ncbi:MAG TPA: hypothetical protein VIW19_11815 [Gaiellaceae bacterium]|jgi:hypothetical protein